jgi:hypothetical protein
LAKFRHQLKKMLIFLADSVLKDHLCEYFSQLLEPEQVLSFPLFTLLWVMRLVAFVAPPPRQSV